MLKKRICYIVIAVLTVTFSLTKRVVATDSILTINVDKNKSTLIDLDKSSQKNRDLLYAITTLPAHGKLVGVLPKINYIPDVNYHGKDKFRYLVGVKGNVYKFTTVEINIKSVNAKPSVKIYPKRANLIIYQEIRFKGMGSDTDGQVVKYSWSENGAVLGEDDIIKYIPTTPGKHKLLLTVTDNEGGIATRTATVYARPQHKPYPAGDEIPFGFMSIGDVDGGPPQKVFRQGFTIIHPHHAGTYEPESVKNDIYFARKKHFVKYIMNSTAADMLSDSINDPTHDLSHRELYKKWDNWVGAIYSGQHAVKPGETFGFYLPDEPPVRTYSRIRMISGIMKKYDPAIKTLVYTGAIAEGDLSNLLDDKKRMVSDSSLPEAAIDIVICGGYPIEHRGIGTPNTYRGHGWTFAHIEQTAPIFKKYGKTCYMTCEGFGKALLLDNAKERILSHLALGILGGAQGVFTYSYSYSANDQESYSAYTDFIPVYRKLWNWIKEGKRTKLNVTILSDIKIAPFYNLQYERKYSSVVAYHFKDKRGREMFGYGNLLDNYSDTDRNGKLLYKNKSVTVKAEISQLPPGIWYEVTEKGKRGKRIEVGKDGKLLVSVKQFGYKFYIKK